MKAARFEDLSREDASRLISHFRVKMSTGNPLLDRLVLLGRRAGAGYRLKKDSPERAEVPKIKSANSTTVALMAQKHDSYRKPTDNLGRSIQGNQKVDPAADAQAAWAALASNFGIIT
jgi:hypothetical protein